MSLFVSCLVVHCSIRTLFPHIHTIPHLHTHPKTTTHAQALELSNLSPDHITYVNAHATSTPAGDLAEYRAIRSALPGPQVRINSTKSMIGHLLGAAGAVEAVATVKAIQTGMVQNNNNSNNSNNSNNN